jgi:polar amino acid transport system permease protein
VAVAIIALVFASLVASASANPNYQWSVVGHYLFAAPILTGLSHTVELTVASMAIGIGLGVVLAVMRLSPNPVISTAASVYIWVFRGVPVLVQLLFWYFLSALFPRLSIGIPFGPSVLSVDTNQVITQLTAAVLGLGLSEGAYMAEIVRSGILSVSQGQNDAAKSLGMKGLLTMRRIVLPQALRIIIPPTGNETIGMLKNTSMVIVIAYTDLLTSASLIYARTFETIPLLIVACIWYLAVTTVLMFIQSGIERRFGRGFTPRREAGWLARTRDRWFKRPAAAGAMDAPGARNG